MGHVWANSNLSRTQKRPGDLGTIPLTMYSNEITLSFTQNKPDQCSNTSVYIPMIFQYICMYTVYSTYIYIYIYIYMAVNQNCVWNVPRCSGRMERRGLVTGLVPDLWSVVKNKLYK